jgi:tetratricopeptide (TPR) repeat protein
MCFERSATAAGHSGVLTGYTHFNLREKDARDAAKTDEALYWERRSIAHGLTDSHTRISRALQGIMPKFRWLLAQSYRFDLLKDHSLKDLSDVIRDFNGLPVEDFIHNYRQTIDTAVAAGPKGIAKIFRDLLDQFVGYEILLLLLQDARPRSSTRLGKLQIRLQHFVTATRGDYEKLVRTHFEVQDESMEQLPAEELLKRTRVEELLKQIEGDEKSPIEWLICGRALDQVGRFLEAAEAYGQGMAQLDPFSDMDFFETLVARRILSLERAERLDEALRLIANLPPGPRSARLSSLIAETYHSAGRGADAIAHYTRTIAMNEEEAVTLNARCNRAIAYKNQGLYSAASTDLDVLVAHRPDVPEFLLLRARLFVLEGGDSATEGAVRHFGLALIRARELERRVQDDDTILDDPFLDRSHGVLATIVITSTRALHEFRHILKTQQRWDLLVHLANDFLSAAQIQGNLDEQAKALELKAVIWEWQDNAVEAARFFAEAVAVAPKGSPIGFDYAAALMRNRRWQQTAPVFARIWHEMDLGNEALMRRVDENLEFTDKFLYPATPRRKLHTRAEVADLTASLGRFVNPDLLVERAHLLLSLGAPNREQIYYVLLVASMEMENWSQVEQDLNSAFLDPGVAAALNEDALFHKLVRAVPDLMKSNWDGLPGLEYVERLAQHFLARAPDNLDRLVFYADATAARGNLGAARRLYRQALWMRPDSEYLKGRLRELHGQRA